MIRLRNGQIVELSDGWIDLQIQSDKQNNRRTNDQTNRQRDRGLI